MPELDTAHVDPTQGFPAMPNIPLPLVLTNEDPDYALFASSDPVEAAQLRHVYTSIQRLIDRLTSAEPAEAPSLQERT